MSSWWALALTACVARDAVRPGAPVPSAATAETHLVVSLPMEAEAPFEAATPARTGQPSVRPARAHLVWAEMFAGAERTIDVAEFYASEAEHGERPDRLRPIVDGLIAAAHRRVRVRFLADASFEAKYPRTLTRLEAGGVEVRRIDFSRRGGGIHHAKYFVVDRTRAFLGSQNFDWRALAHIEEVGVRLDSPVLGHQLTELFEADWAFAGGDASGVKASSWASPDDGVPMLTGERVAIVASPRGSLPDERAWDLPRLVGWIDAATRTLDVQLLTYTTTYRDGAPFLDLDAALHRAIARGVRVRLLLSSWALAKKSTHTHETLDALDAPPNAEVRILTIPPASTGEIPFARVAHAKYLVIDGEDSAGHANAWVGTSNWEGDYFTKSRNVGALIAGGQLPHELEALFEAGWSGPYAAPLARAAAPSPRGAP